MKRVFALILVVASASTFGVEYMQMSNIEHLLFPAPSDRIVGGDAIPITKAPWQIGLEINKSGWCGGSLIADNLVITAAHCVDQYAKDDYVVYMGSATRKQGVSRKVEEIIIHEKWDSAKIRNDIAILRIEKVDLSEDIKPVKLPSLKFDLKVGSIVTATGWGKTSDGLFATVSKTLQSAELKTISLADCKKVYGTTVQESNICVETVDGKSTCQGDSGGPLVDESEVLVGLTSFGSSAGCTKQKPAAFTSVMYYLDWIKEKTNL